MKLKQACLIHSIISHNDEDEGKDFIIRNWSKINYKIIDDIKINIVQANKKLSHDK